MDIKMGCASVYNTAAFIEYTKAMHEMSQKKAKENL